MDVSKYFEALRFDERHHLGLGDIRLTVAQQDEIVAAVEKAREEGYDAAISELNDVWRFPHYTERERASAKWCVARLLARKHTALTPPKEG